MRINHNIASLNTYRQLSTNSANGSKSLEKLSSGLRINRAGDDAAGLAISEKMRGQIRGLDQAARNSQDGISLIQTAEGALNETHSILQRMRELGVQSTNGSLTDDDRSKIQGELNQLVDEIDNIGNQTQFNTKNLLNGSIGQSYTSNNAVGQNGATDYTGLTVKSITSDTKSGSYAVNVTTAATKASVGATTSGAAGTYAGGFASGDAIEVNDIRIDFSTSDTIASAMGKINVKSNETGVEAFVNQDGGIAFRSLEYGSDAKVDIDDTIVAGTLEKLNSALTTNTYSVTGTDIAGSINGAVATGKGTTLSLASTGNLANGITVQAENVETAASLTLSWNTSPTTATGATSTLVVNGTTVNLASGITMTDAITALNAQSDKTGVIASAATDGSSKVVLSTIAKGSGVTGEGVGIDVGAFTGVTAAGGFGDGTNANFVKINSAAYATSAAGNADAVGSSNMDATLEDAVVTVDSNNTLAIHTGSNENQVLEISINDMRSSAIGKGVTNNSSLTSLSDLKSKGGVSSSAKSEDSIKIIDQAIKTVSEQRAKLGSYQNRLEHSIANLSTSSENLTAAESRIRDVDMAKEMMEFTKNNILSQAAQAMLAQANQQPQGVLQLLR